MVFLSAVRENAMLSAIKLSLVRNDGHRKQAL